MASDHGRLPALWRRPYNEFREHFAFLGIMIVLCACMVYLMGLFRVLLRPFLLALFLVMGLAPAVSSLERCLLGLTMLLWRCAALLCRWICRVIRGESTTVARGLRQRRSESGRELIAPAVLGVVEASIRYSSNSDHVARCLQADIGRWMRMTRVRR